MNSNQPKPAPTGKEGMSDQLRAAFEDMKQTEMELDDMDYLTESPKLQKAMKAAEHFRELLDRKESR